MVKVPLEVKVWMVYPPDVVIVPPVAGAGNPEPEMVIFVPPAVDPDEGDTVLMDGCRLEAVTVLRVGDNVLSVEVMKDLNCR